VKYKNSSSTYNDVIIVYINSSDSKQYRTGIDRSIRQLLADSRSIVDSGRVGPAAEIKSIRL